MDQDNITTVKIEKELCIRTAGISIIGTRDYQQDAYFMSENPYGVLAVVCDGMGGLEGGEMASQKAVELLISDFEEADLSAEDPCRFLVREVIRMDERVHGLTDEEGRKLDAGSTLAAVFVSQKRAWWVSVGDSVIYVIREGEIRIVNHMHNYKYRLEEKLQSKEITQEEYEEEIKQGEALVSYLGMGGLEMIDRNRKPFFLEEGDQILIGSDGIYKALSEDILCEVLSEEGRPIGQVLRDLMERVKTSGKRSLDNTTVILMRVEEAEAI